MDKYGIGLDDELLDSIPAPATLESTLFDILVSQFLPEHKLACPILKWCGRRILRHTYRAYPLRFGGGVAVVALERAMSWHDGDRIEEHRVITNEASGPRSARAEYVLSGNSLVMQSISWSDGSYERRRVNRIDCNTVSFVHTYSLDGGQAESSEETTVIYDSEQYPVRAERTITAASIQTSERISIHREAKTKKTVLHYTNNIGSEQVAILEAKDDSRFEITQHEQPTGQAVKCVSFSYLRGNRLKLEWAYGPRLIMREVEVWEASSSGLWRVAFVGYCKHGKFWGKHVCYDAQGNVKTIKFTHGAVANMLSEKDVSSQISITHERSSLRSEKRGYSGLESEEEYRLG